MSFLKGSPVMGGAAPNGAAEGLGHLLNVSPVGISNFADTVGKISNGIAGAGGATEAYQAPEAAPVANYMQFLDPAVLQQIVQQFGGQPRTGYSQ